MGHQSVGGWTKAGCAWQMHCEGPGEEGERRAARRPEIRERRTLCDRLVHSEAVRATDVSPCSSMDQDIKLLQENTILHGRLNIFPRNTNFWKMKQHAINKPTKIVFKRSFYKVVIRDRW